MDIPVFFRLPIFYFLILPGLPLAGQNETEEEQMPDFETYWLQFQNQAPETENLSNPSTEELWETYEEASTLGEAILISEVEPGDYIVDVEYFQDEDDGEDPDESGWVDAYQDIDNFKDQVREILLATAESEEQRQQFQNILALQDRIEQQLIDQRNQRIERADSGFNSFETPEPIYISFRELLERNQRITERITEEAEGNLDGDYGNFPVTENTEFRASYADVPGDPNLNPGPNRQRLNRTSRSEGNEAIQNRVQQERQRNYAAPPNALNNGQDLENLSEDDLDAINLDEDSGLEEVDLDETFVQLDTVLILDDDADENSEEAAGFIELDDILDTDDEDIEIIRTSADPSPENRNQTPPNAGDRNSQRQRIEAAQRERAERERREALRRQQQEVERRQQQEAAQRQREREQSDNRNRNR